MNDENEMIRRQRVDVPKEYKDIHESLDVYKNNDLSCSLR